MLYSLPLKHGYWQFMRGPSALLTFAYFLTPHRKRPREMGAAFRKLFGKKDMRILMLGLDAAGKTSIL